jgi:hypothetical protein
MSGFFYHQGHVRVMFRDEMDVDSECESLSHTHFSRYFRKPCSQSEPPFNKCFIYFSIIVPLFNFFLGTWSDLDRELKAQLLNIPCSELRALCIRDVNSLFRL